MPPVLFSHPLRLCLAGAAGSWHSKQWRKPPKDKLLSRRSLTCWTLVLEASAAVSGWHAPFPLRAWGPRWLAHAVTRSKKGLLADAPTDILSLGAEGRFGVSRSPRCGILTVLAPYPNYPLPSSIHTTVLLQSFFLSICSVHSLSR